MVDVSTTATDSLQQRNGSRYDALRHFLTSLGNVHELLGPEQLLTRLNALDELDAIVGDFDPEMCPAWADAQTIACANALQHKFEAANEKLFALARFEISIYGDSPSMRHWLSDAAKDQDCEEPKPGLGFDLLDDIVSGVLRLRIPAETGPLRSSEMVPYQPTPTRHILDLINKLDLSEDNVLVDLGSGLGHVPLLVTILTGCQTFGVELEAHYVASAQESARNLGLNQVQFVKGDARTADMSTGTVFYLFSPFSGSILRHVLQRLHRESNHRQIRICSLGPCTGVLRDQDWLLERSSPQDGRIAIFKSR